MFHAHPTRRSDYCFISQVWLTISPHCLTLTFTFHIVVTSLSPIQMFPKLKNVVTLEVTDILSRETATRGESYAREFWLWALCSSGGSMVILQVMGVLKFPRFFFWKRFFKFFFLKPLGFTASEWFWVLKNEKGRVLINMAEAANTNDQIASLSRSIGQLTRLQGSGSHGQILSKLHGTCTPLNTQG